VWSVVESEREFGNQSVVTVALDCQAAVLTGILERSCIRSLLVRTEDGNYEFVSELCVRARIFTSRLLFEVLQMSKCWKIMNLFRLTEFLDAAELLIWCTLPA
jgi:hypothetical protein